MLRLRSVYIPGLVLTAFVQAIGILLLTEHFGGTVAALLIVTLPLMFVGLPGVLRQAVDALVSIRRQLSWWHFSWLMIFLSGIIFRVRETETLLESPVDFWAAYRITLVGVVALVLTIRLALGKTPWLESVSRGLIGALATYCLICVASTVWSVYPAWTLYKSLEYFVDVALIAAILSHVQVTADFKRVFDWAWTLLIATLASIWIGAAVWPQEALVSDIGSLGVQVQGVLPAISANGVGELSALLAVVAFCRLQFTRRRALYSLLLGISLLTLTFSQTRSAVIGFLLGVALVLFCSKRLGWITFLVWISVLLFLTTSTADVFWLYFQRGQDEGNIQNLTGRVDWWKTSLEQLFDQPLTGYGAYAGARFVTMAELGDNLTSTLHNTYFEVLLGTSIWGIIPVAATFIGTWSTLITVLRDARPTALERQLAIEAIALLGVITARSFFSSAAIVHPDLVFLSIVGYAELLRRRATHGARFGASTLAWHSLPAPES
jgi:O-antigen ligase